MFWACIHTKLPPTPTPTLCQITAIALKIIFNSAKQNSQPEHAQMNNAIQPSSVVHAVTLTYSNTYIFFPCSIYCKGDLTHAMPLSEVY